MVCPICGRQFVEGEDVCSYPYHDSDTCSKPAMAHANCLERGGGGNCACGHPIHEYGESSTWTGN